MKIKFNNILKITNDKKMTNKENLEKLQNETINYDTQELNNVKKRRRNINKTNKYKFKECIKNLLFNRNNFSRGTYTLLFLMFSLAIVSVTITYKTYKMANQEKYISFISEEEVQAVSNNIDEQIVEQDNKTNNYDVNQEKKQEESNVIEEVNKKIEQVEEKVDFKIPISGNIQKIYSADKVIYSKTLEMWKTHDGIDISGKIGEAVYAAEKGTIEKIFNDSFLGMTVVISHSLNYKTSYSNLDEDVCVKVGQNVKRGQRIGNISDTAIGEIKDDPHLHFMVFKDNETIDPSTVLN